MGEADRQVRRITKMMMIRIVPSPMYMARVLPARIGRQSLVTLRLVVCHAAAGGLER
jgi:hypothetical protein